jgi:hypothetical protein
MRRLARALWGEKLTIGIVLGGLAVTGTLGYLIGAVIGALVGAGIGFLLMLVIAMMALEPI